MKIPDEIVNLLRIKDINDTIIYFATSSLKGNTNLLPVSLTDVYLNEYILLPDLFAQKTKVNLNENRIGVVSIVLPDDYRNITIEGPANIIQWGHPKSFRFYDLTAKDILENWGVWTDKEDVLNEKNENKPQVFKQRGVIVIKAESINFN